MPETINAFLSEWTTAEQAGDSAMLGNLLCEDFQGVGPLGFVLPRPAWLGRHHQGLAYEHFSLEKTQVRGYGGVAVVTARINALGTYQGQPLPEALRATLVIASDSETLRLAAIHMSFIAGTQGSPPVPVPTGTAESRAHTHTDWEG